MTISRRVFVKSSGLALVSLGLEPLFLGRAVFGSYRPLPSLTGSDRPVLVCLFQRGAVDGLNMIVPHGDPLYYEERPRIAVPQEGAPDKLTRAVEELYEGEGTGLLASSSREGFDAIQMLKRADPSQYRPAAGVDYPQGRLGRTLLQIAQLIKSDVGLEIAFADCSGWDTHVNQGSNEGQLAARLRELGLALSAFSRDLGRRLTTVVVLTMSEFGRTIRENGNSGTDHGHATAMLVMGGPVNGGRVLGRWPGLRVGQRLGGRGGGG